MTPLYGHTSEATAYLVEDYPYSFKLRCRIRYWLEYGGPSKGFRFVSQTENPKTGRWNAPKKSTYSAFAGAMFLDEQGHVAWDGVTEYTDGAKTAAFVRAFPGAVTPILRVWIAKKLRYYTLATEGKVVFSINGVAQPVTEADLARYHADLADWLAASEALPPKS